MAGPQRLLEHLVDPLEARCELRQLGVRRRLDPSFRLQAAELPYQLTAAPDRVSQLARLLRDHERHG